MVRQECNTNQHDMFCISRLTLCIPVCLTCLYSYAADTSFYDEMRREQPAIPKPYQATCITEQTTNLYVLGLRYEP